MAIRELVPCPSTAAYKRGCRCNECVLEYGNYQRRRLGKPELMLDITPSPSSTPHQTKQTTMPQSYIHELVDKQQRVIGEQRQVIVDLLDLLADAAHLIPEYRWRSIGYRVVDAKNRAKRIGNR